MILKPNTASKVPFYLVDAGGAGIAGETVTAEVSKDGAAFTAGGGGVGDLGGGDYVYTTTGGGGDTDTEGSLQFRFTSGGSTGARVTAQVDLPLVTDQTDKLTFDGFNALSVNVLEWNNAFVSDLPPNFNVLSIDGSGRVSVFSIATDAITDDSLAASAVTEIVTAIAAGYPANFSSLVIDGGTGGVTVAAMTTGVITAASIAANALDGTGDWLTAGGYTAPDNAGIADIQARLPATLVSGRMDSSVGAMAANTITSTAIAAGAITDAKITFPAETAGRPSTALAVLRRVWERLANKRDRNRSTGAVVLYGADNTTVLETQTQSTTGSVDTQTKGA